MRALVCCLLLACGALSAGCGSSPDEATFDCDRGFRAADWSSHARLKTGQSIAKCGWLKGWSQSRVRRVLGRPDFGPAHAPEYVLPGGRDANKNLQEWLLKLRFDGQSGRLVHATTEMMPI